MATKDWKKTLNNRSQLIWKNKKNNVHIQINESHGEWNFGVLGRKFNKRLKNKSAALKFAKSYMRKH